MPSSKPVYGVADFVQQASAFMRDYFGGDLKGAWMTAFYIDPGKATSADWSGGPAEHVLAALPAFIEAHGGWPPNLYFSPYRFDGKRDSVNFIEAVAIPIDDVGLQADVEEASRRHEAALQAFKAGPLAEWKRTPAEQRSTKPPRAPRRQGVKVAREALQAKYGLPSTALQTSAGSDHWFYRLDTPCRDKAQMRAMLMALGSDARDLARYMRVPGGANWKAAALSAGGEPFLVVPDEGYSGGSSYRMVDLLAAAGASPAPEEPRQQASGGEEKLEVRALREAGLLLGSAETGTAETKGAIWMECPGHSGGEDTGGWVGAELGHSEGRDLGRAKVWTFGGFQCFHDSCRERTFNDLCTWIERHPEAGPILARLKAEQVVAELPPIVGGEEDDDEDIIGGDDAPYFIRVRPGELPYQTRQVVKALRARRPVYYYGRKTVQVLALVERKGIGGKVKVAQIAQLEDVAVVLDLIEGVVDWLRFDKKTEEWVRCNAPERVAKNLRANKALDFEEIVGVIRSPFLRHNGTIGGLTEGYDDLSGLWVDYAGVEYRPLTDAECTRAGAEAALKRIKAPLAEYRFSDPVGRAVALAAMLTPVARPAVSLVPLFAIDAPIQGSGKTKLALSICSLVTGLAPIIVQGTADPIELAKRFNGALLSGEQCIVIDNLVGKGWSSSDICAAITTERVNIRPLGKSPPVPINNTFLIIVTGNNLIMEGDIVRRALTTRIDPDVDRPERERYSFDPIEYVKEHRADLIHDLLLVLRAYVLAGRPKQKGHEIGSFGPWSRVVRDALMWLDEPDVAESIDFSRASNSPELEALLPAWEAAFGLGEHTAKRVKDLLGRELSVEPKLKAFGEIVKDNILSLGADRKYSEAGWFGTWLGSKVDQRAQGIKLRRRLLNGNWLYFVVRPDQTKEEDDNPVD